MNSSFLRLSTLALFAGLFLLQYSFGQQSGAASPQSEPDKAPTPGQQEQQRQDNLYRAKRLQLQSEAKTILDAEMAREDAGDCSDAKTTSDFNTCFDRQLAATDQSLARFAEIIRKLQEAAPSSPVRPEDGASGPAGPASTPQQELAEFDQLEQAWRNYRQTACKVAFHQFDGGSGGPSFDMQCQLKLIRDHLRELDMIYGIDLHL